MKKVIIFIAGVFCFFALKAESDTVKVEKERRYLLAEPYQVVYLKEATVFLKNGEKLENIRIRDMKGDKWFPEKIKIINENGKKQWIKIIDIESVEGNIKNALGAAKLLSTGIVKTATEGRTPWHGKIIFENSELPRKGFKLKETILCRLNPYHDKNTDIKVYGDPKMKQTMDWTGGIVGSYTKTFFLKKDGKIVFFDKKKIKKGELHDFLSDCPKFVEKYPDKKLSVFELNNYINFYNENCK